QDQQIFGRADVEQEFAESPRKRRDGGDFVVEAGTGAIALGGLYELEFLEVAGKGRLGDPQTLLSQAAAHLFLVGDTLAANEAEDLAVTECLCSAHANKIFTRLYIYTVPTMGVSNNFCAGTGTTGAHRPG